MRFGRGRPTRRTRRSRQAALDPKSRDPGLMPALRHERLAERTACAHPRASEAEVAERSTRRLHADLSSFASSAGFGDEVMPPSRTTSVENRQQTARRRLGCVGIRGAAGSRPPPQAQLPRQAPRPGENDDSASDAHLREQFPLRSVASARNDRHDGQFAASVAANASIASVSAPQLVAFATSKNVCAAGRRNARRCAAGHGPSDSGHATRRAGATPTHAARRSSPRAWPKYREKTPASVPPVTTVSASSTPKRARPSPR